MPVKVADRYGTGCADANQTGSLDICCKLYSYVGYEIKTFFLKFENIYK